MSHCSQFLVMYCHPLGRVLAKSAKAMHLRMENNDLPLWPKGFKPLGLCICKKLRSTICSMTVLKPTILPPPKSASLIRRAKREGCCVRGTCLCFGAIARTRTCFAVWLQPLRAFFLAPSAYWNILALQVLRSVRDFSVVYRYGPWFSRTEV